MTDFAPEQVEFDFGTLGVEEANEMRTALNDGEHFLVRHLKRGSEYRVVGLGEVQISSSEPIKEGDKLVVYQCLEDEKTWLRKVSEFVDGRFEAIGPDDQALVSRTPTDGLLMSMAIRYDHGLGIPGYYDQPMFEGITHKQRLESTLRIMRQIHEEVVGTGFYNPAREEFYVAKKEN
jgi:hypothetical protein